jgi:hypothetical protein
VGRHGPSAHKTSAIIHGLMVQAAVLLDCKPPHNGPGGGMRPILRRSTCSKLTGGQPLQSSNNGAHSRRMETKPQHHFQHIRFDGPSSCAVGLQTTTQRPWWGDEAHPRAQHLQQAIRGPAAAELKPVHHKQGTDTGALPPFTGLVATPIQVALPLLSHGIEAPTLPFALAEKALALNQAV